MIEVQKTKHNIVYIHYCAGYSQESAKVTSLGEKRIDGINSEVLGARAGSALYLLAFMRLTKSPMPTAKDFVSFAIAKRMPLRSVARFKFGCFICSYRI